MDPYLAELIAEGDPSDEVAVLLRLSNATAAPPQVRLVAQFDDVATGRLLRSEIVAVHDADTVRSTKAAQLIGPSLADDTEAEMLPDVLQDSDVRRPDVAGLPTGAGVVVAHIDWGVDVAHADFRLPDGRTRLLALWDQRGAAFPDRPNRYGYGRIFSHDDIDAALASGDPYRALGYDPADFDTARGTHGTHTLSISAGNGRSGGPSGMAPEASIIFVHLSTYTAEGPTDLGDSVAYVEAIDFILRTAARGGDGRPPAVVVNSSLGKQAGSHLGLSLVERALDAALREAPGRAFVHSAGNYFNRRMHAAGTLRPGQSHTLRLAVEASADATHGPETGGVAPRVTHTPCEVEVWYPGVDRLAVVVTAPDGTRYDAVRGDQSSTLRTTADAAPRAFGRLRHRLDDPNNGDNEAVLFLYKGAPAGVYEITLIGEDVADGRYHVWIERNAGGRGARSEFVPGDSVAQYTTGTICNGFRTIAVGAYDAHAWQRDGDVADTGRPLAAFSSSGPTADGRQKPDLCAPGVQVLGARSRPRDWPGRSRGEPPPYVTRLSGTSMAAPCVAGAVAIMFEAAGRPLAIDETRRLLLAATDPPPSDASDAARLRIGSGFLNVEAAVAAVRDRAHPPARARPPIEVQPPMTTAAARESDGSEFARQDESDAGVWRDYPEYDADRYVGRGETAMSESTRDAAGRFQRDPLPFTFVVPLGGGGIVPALSLPLGGAGSPLAIAVPLTGTATPTPPTAAT
ncbi:MAG TPA: S8 family serine peptidase, partial [Gemmatirosa sp.]